jgi:hypothetical protein
VGTATTCFSQPRGICHADCAFAPSCLVLVCGFSLPLASGDDPKPSNFGLAVGKKMPFHVADFVNGKDKDHGGCPSVMISNTGGRGIIVWSRGPVEPAFKLAKALDVAAADGDKLERFLVVFDTDGKVVAEKGASLTRVVVGRARHSASEEFDRRGIDTKSLVLVFMLDKKDIKAMWSFGADEPGQGKIKELVAAGKKFAAGEK